MDPYLRGPDPVLYWPNMVRTVDYRRRGQRGGPQDEVICYGIGNLVYRWSVDRTIAYIERRLRDLLEERLGPEGLQEWL